jgi:hypothetical protein
MARQRQLFATWAVIRHGSHLPLLTFGDRALAERWYRDHDGHRLGLAVVKLKTVAEFIDVPRPETKYTEALRCAS